MPAAPLRSATRVVEWTCSTSLAPVQACNVGNASMTSVRVDIKGSGSSATIAASAALVLASILRDLGPRRRRRVADGRVLLLLPGSGGRNPAVALVKLGLGRFGGHSVASVGGGCRVELVPFALWARGGREPTTVETPHRTDKARRAPGAPILSPPCPLLALAPQAGFCSSVACATVEPAA